MNEDLRDWFRDKWVRMNTKGDIIGDCARDEGEGKPKCLPIAKARAMSKDDRAAAARRKRREDPVADRSGKGEKPVNVATEEVSTSDLIKKSHSKRGAPGTLKAKIKGTLTLAKVRSLKNRANATTLDKKQANFYINMQSEEYLEEKNVPTNPGLWARAKTLARSKFDVYPSAYANGWAAKWYKGKGGSWKSVQEGRKMKTLNDILAEGVAVSSDFKLVNSVDAQGRPTTRKVRAHRKTISPQSEDKSDVLTSIQKFVGRQYAEEVEEFGEANIEPTSAKSRSHIGNLSNPVTNSVVHPSSGKEIGIVSKQSNGEYHAQHTATALSNQKSGTFDTKDKAHQFVRDAHAKAIKNNTLSDKFLKRKPLPQFQSKETNEEVELDEVSTDGYHKAAVKSRKENILKIMTSMGSDKSAKTKVDARNKGLKRLSDRTSAEMKKANSGPQKPRVEKEPTEAERRGYGQDRYMGDSYEPQGQMVEGQSASMRMFKALQKIKQQRETEEARKKENEKRALTPVKEQTYDESNPKIKAALDKYRAHYTDKTLPAAPQDKKPDPNKYMSKDGGAAGDPNEYELDPFNPSTPAYKKRQAQAEQYVGTGESKSMQLARQKAVLNAKANMMKDRHGDNFQDQLAPMYDESDIKTTPNEKGDGYRTTLTITPRDSKPANTKKQGVEEAKDPREYDYEGDMAKTQLRSIIANSQAVHDMLKDTTNLAEWVQSKITKAEDYISTVADYMTAEMNEQYIVEAKEDDDEDYSKNHKLDPDSGVEADQHIHVQLKKAIDSTMKPYEVSFKNGKKHTVSSPVAKTIVTAVEKLKPEHRKFAHDELHKSYDSLMAVHKAITGK